MITFMRGFSTNDGQIFKTIQEAQVHEVEMLLLETNLAESGHSTEMATVIVEHKDQLVDVLTMTENSKPRARKVNGGTKKRAAKDAPAEPAK